MRKNTWGDVSTTTSAADTALRKSERDDILTIKLGWTSNGSSITWHSTLFFIIEQCSPTFFDFSLVSATLRDGIGVMAFFLDQMFTDT